MPTVSTSNASDEKLKAFLPVTALATVKHHKALHAADSNAAYARYQAREASRADLQTLHATLQAMAYSPKRDKEAEARVEKEIADLKAALASEDAELAARGKDAMNAATPHAWNSLEVSLRLHLNSKRKAFGFNEPLLEGKTERQMVDGAREKNTTLQAERDRILKAPTARAEAVARITAEVTRVGKLARLRNPAVVTYDPDHRRFKAPEFNLPKVALVDGVGQTMVAPDGLSLLCALFPDEVTERLSAKLLAKVDDSRAMTMPDRVAALAAVDAQILENDRRGEFWIRQCYAKGIAGGPRWTEDMRAILDID